MEECCLLAHCLACSKFMLKGLLKMYPMNTCLLMVLPSGLNLLYQLRMKTLHDTMPTGQSNLDSSSFEVFPLGWPYIVSSWQSNLTRTQSHLLHTRKSQGFRTHSRNQKPELTEYMASCETPNVILVVTTCSHFTGEKAEAQKLLVTPGKREYVETLWSS